MKNLKLHLGPSMSISFLAPFLLSMKVSYRQILAEQIELNTIYRKKCAFMYAKIDKEPFFHE